MSAYSSLPEIRKDELLFQDTSGKPLPGTIVPCLLCTKPFLMRMYMGEPDQICPECYVTYKECARVVCARCKVTICRVVPKLLDNGYLIRPKSILHIDQCNTCKPGLQKSTVLEIETWQRTQRQHKPTIIVPKGTPMPDRKKRVDGVKIISE